jgi:hypothetical protein
VALPEARTAPTNCRLRAAYATPAKNACAPPPEWGATQTLGKWAPSRAKETR